MIRELIPTPPLFPQNSAGRVRLSSGCFIHRWCRRGRGRTEAGQELVGPRGGSRLGVLRGHKVRSSAPLASCGCRVWPPWGGVGTSRRWMSVHLGGDGCAVVLGAGRVAVPCRSGLPFRPLPREPRDPRGSAGQAAGGEADRGGPRRRRRDGRRVAQGLPSWPAAWRAPAIDYLEGNMTSVAAPGPVPRHHGARQPAPLRREGGLGAVRLVVPGLRHGQAHKPLRGRPGRPAASLA